MMVDDDDDDDVICMAMMVVTVRVIVRATVIVIECANHESMNPSPLVNHHASNTKGMVMTLRRWTSVCR